METTGQIAAIVLPNGHLESIVYMRVSSVVQESKGLG
jgi:hypothetical protein